jgi:hypothetical protein
MTAGPGCGLTRAFEDNPARLMPLYMGARPIIALSGTRLVERWRLIEIRLQIDLKWQQRILFAR